MTGRRIGTTRNFLWTAAVVAGGALLASGAGLAHDGQRHAASDAHQHVAHAGHPQTAASDSKAGEYSRSVHVYSVPDIMLIDRYARQVRLREVLAADEPVMMNFIFTTCTAICPVMTSIFSDVSRQLGTSPGKLRMISISIDPENDTPPQLMAYARKFDAGPRWQFLTGRIEDIAAVQRAFDSYRGDKMSHEPLTLLRSAPDRPWVRIEGFASPEDLAREYRDAAPK